jgi:L-rhamnose isomerase
MDQADYAKQKYAKAGINVEDALGTLAGIPVSIHCWQGDDVGGFEYSGEALSGGIQATGSYPGKARTPEELMADFEKALSLIPGKKRINLHASYAIFNGKKRDRDELLPEDFAPWVAFAKKNGLGIDFNPTFFSHPLAKEGFTLSSPDAKIREFWIRHAKACRRIAAWISEQLGAPVLHNIWIPDGYKNIPADRLGPRKRLRESLDTVYAEHYPGVIDSLESKVFGIGVEAYTTGSSEFYISYAAAHSGIYPLLDNGHYHPTEKVSDKISSLLLFFDKLPLHITRNLHWDSDHVVLYEDELCEIAKEIVRNNAVERVLIGLDFFDASINRVAAWVIGVRSTQKALLYALLQPHEYLKKLQDEARYTELMMLQEELKTYPLGSVWEAYCAEQRVPFDDSWFAEVERYEREVLGKRT